MVNRDYVVDIGNGQVLGKAVKVVEPDEQTAKPGKNIRNRILRELNNEKDQDILRKNTSLEKEAHAACEEKIRQARLPMKLIKAYCLFDASKIVFYFTAETRVDFRNLVKELAAEFHTRIEMKQIGVRDEAKILAGYGACGRPLCCSTFLKDFEPVSIRMAKLQNISLDPSKISGNCNRLMCCMAYEYPQYEASRKNMPRVGEKVVLRQKEGKVVSVDLAAEMIEIEKTDKESVTVGLEEFNKLARSKRKEPAGGKNMRNKNKSRRRNK